ncbi:hypothetical protein GQ55_1G103400 [Panicum hallii var. hallii]|uniref:RING-type E3 ubiquitin transferase n=1 Tax=Panicum hallii var. hallii TaxID=1504633 RepID=A0A2T7F4A5_9POAL|nr:hypothetical protein GQ55_1G103400 [Panicum hallii var. hallii]
MEAASKIVTSLLLNLAWFLPCASAAVSSNPSSFHPSMSKGPIHHDYTRFADVERHCQSVLASAADLKADADRAGDRMHVHQLSFMNGDWSQDAGQAPLLPFHGSYADAAAVAGPELLEAVPLASFMLTHTDMAPRRGARTAFNVSGLLSFTITRNCCCSYTEPRASPEFELRPGVARLHVLLQGVYTETKSSSGSGDGGGGERVLCMVGDAVLPVRGSNITDPWAWAKQNNGGDSNFKPPVVTADNILLVLRYPMTATLTTRAVRGEMTSTRAKSDGAYFDTVRLVSQLAGGYDSGYQFQPEDAALDAVAGCSDDPLFRDGDAMGMEHLNRGGSLCDIVYQSAPSHQVMEVIPNWNCKGTDAFCSQVGPFERGRPVTRAMQDVAFTRSGITVQGLQCKPASSTDGAAGARLAAVFRYVPPWEDQPTAARRTGLSAMTLSAEGVWMASAGRVCMVACLGGDERACHYRVTLSVRKTFSMTRRGSSVGQITAMDGSHPPLLFRHRVNPREQRSLETRMSYIYTKVEQARELLRFKPAGFRDNIVARSLLSYPSIAGPGEDMVSLSNLADDLNLRFKCAVKPPFVPDWIEEPFFELQILSVGTLVGSYPQFQPQFQREFSMRIELLGRARVHAVEKQQILNVSAEFTASRKNFVSPSPVMSLEGVYDPEDGRMYLIGCRNVHAPWRVLSKRRDLEDGMDCSVEMTVEYPPTTTRWLISRAAKVSVASTRAEDDPLHFNRTELRTLPVAYRDQRRDELTEPVVEGLLCVTMLSATIAATVGQLRYVKSHADVAPYVSLVTLGVQALGYSATLVTDARMLPAWPTRRYIPYYAGHLGWIMDRSVKALTLAALLLTARLAQVVSRSRARARARSPLEPGRVPGDGAVLLCSAGVHLGGLLFVLAVHWLSTYGASTADEPPSGVIYGEAQGMPWPARTRAAIVERYAGVAKEWFLLPQVVGNALWRVNCKPLAARYYAGVTAVWLLPHVYGYLRPPVVNAYSEAHGDVVGFYSKASAVVVPVVGFVLALVVYVQQRWNYKIVGWAMRTEKNKLQHVY